MPYQVDAVTAVAKKYEIPIIEDSAEALGSSYHCRKCGTFGDFSILSFNGNKIITTSGGGALVSKSLEAKEKAVFLATQARDEAPHYQHSNIGYNYRLSNVSAGIGRGQMMVLDQRVAARRANHDRYNTIIKTMDGVSMLEEPNTQYYSNHWLSCILVDEKIAGFSSEDLRLAFQKEHIESRPLWKPMHLQPIFKDAPKYLNGISEQLFNTGICSPSGSNLKESQWQRIEGVLTNFV